MGLASGTTISRTRAPQSDPADEASWRTEVRTNTGALLGGEIGTILGSSLGQSLAGGNVFARVAAGTALGAVLGNVGQAFGDMLQNGIGLGDAVETAFGTFSADLGAAFQTQTVGAVSAFLTGELADALGFDGTGFGDQLLQSVTGAIGGAVGSALVGASSVYGSIGSEAATARGCAPLAHPRQGRAPGPVSWARSERRALRSNDRFPKASGLWWEREGKALALRLAKDNARAKWAAYAAA